nr:hypothetical protein [Tanacetum cinerariifolium]
MTTSSTSSLLSANSPTTNLPLATTTNLPPATSTTTNLPPATLTTSHLLLATSTTSHLPPTTSLTSHLLPSISTARACNRNEANLFVVPVVGEENLLIEAEIEELDGVTMNEDVEANVMSRDVITFGSTMRIPLLYRGKYSQWRERFMNYLEGQTDGEAMINSIQNAIEGEQLLDTYLRYLQVINDLKKCGYKKDNFCQQKKEFVKSDDKKEDKKADEKKRDMSKIKCYNCKKEGHFAKDCNKAKVKDYNYYKTKMLLAKKDSDEQVLLAEDQAWMESSGDFNQEINANMTVHMIMPSKDSLYDGKKGIGFENLSYFEKAKDLRPTLYDEKVIGLGYTPMFLTHSDKALEIEKFKRSIENKIKFAYDYGNLNASYVNEKINFSDDYFQEIINPNFNKIDSPFQQTSLLKPYVLNVILEKIIIDLEDEVVSLLEKEKANLKTIESLKSKECDKVENSKVIAPGMFKLSVSQSVSPISMSKTSCDSNNVERETSSAYVYNDAMNVSCNSRTCDLFDDHNFFIFDDESVRISPVSKMPFRKKPRDSMNVRSKRCSKHMTGNRALLTNFVEKFLRTVRFGNNNFAVITGYGDVGLEVAFRKSTCFVRNEDCVDLLTGDRSSNLYTIALNEVASNSSTFLLAKASSSQSWLWYQRLSHLNFATINNLVKTILFKVFLR